MEIIIKNSKKLKTIQEEFNEHFRFLKIEFFSHSHDEYAASDKKYLIDPDKTIGECRTVSNNKDILRINGNQKVREIEQLFWKNYGVAAQVFRRSGTVWIETTVTDMWTLNEQNIQGELLSQSYIVK